MNDLPDDGPDVLVSWRVLKALVDRAPASTAAVRARKWMEEELADHRAREAEEDSND